MTGSSWWSTSTATHQLTPKQVRPRSQRPGTGGSNQSVRRYGASDC
jgi:hypothetical protein